MYMYTCVLVKTNYSPFSVRNVRKYQSIVMISKLGQSEICSFALVEKNGFE